MDGAAALLRQRTRFHWHACVCAWLCVYLLCVGCLFRLAVLIELNWLGHTLRHRCSFFACHSRVCASMFVCGICALRTVVNLIFPADCTLRRTSPDAQHSTSSACVRVRVYVCSSVCLRLCFPVPYPRVVRFVSYGSQTVDSGLQQQNTTVAQRDKLNVCCCCCCSPLLKISYYGYSHLCISIYSSLLC